MKKVEKGIFFLNGVEERVITLPKDRNDLIEITFGGKDVGFKEKIPLSVFEDQTNYYIEGLEPEFEIDVNKVISAFESQLVGVDFKISEELKADVNTNTISAGGCKFANHRDVTMAASFIVYDKDDDGTYAIHTMKYDGGKNIFKNILATEIDLEDKLNEALGILKSYVSTRVQILNKVVDKDTVERSFSEDGYPMLKTGETLSDYFDSVDDIAGIVINSKGKYQPFHSYVMYNGKDTIHYDTKDYKTLGGAVKLLKKYGFDAEGRMLDNMGDEFKKDFTEAIMRDLGASVGEDNWGSFALGDSGWVEVKAPVKIQNKIRGYCYELPYVFTEEISGRTISRVQEIKNSVDMSAWNASRFFATEMHDFRNEIESGSAPDAVSKTPTQQKAYHASRYKYHEHRCKWIQERVDSQEKSLASLENPSEHDKRWLNTDRERLSAVKDMMKHHQDSYRVLQASIEPSLGKTS